SRLGGIRATSVRPRESGDPGFVAWIPACAGMNGKRVVARMSASEIRDEMPSLRRNDAQPLALALRMPLVAPEPDLHAIEIKIDPRRGVERQELAQREAADHGVAERLAQLRPRTVTERERYAREHRRRRRHQDRAEAQQAGFADRGDRRHVTVAFGHDG